MKPFSLNTKGHFILFKEREKKSLSKMKRAPKKPILKPFQEEQSSPMGHFCMPTNNKSCFNTQIGIQSLWWMLFFETNTREQYHCSNIYNLHIHLKHWLGGSAGRTKITRCKISASIQKLIQCVQTRDSLKERVYSQCAGLWGGWGEAWWEVISSLTSTRGGDPAHQDRQHHIFQSFTSLFCLFFFSFKFSQEVLQCRSGSGRPLWFSSLRFN